MISLKDFKLFAAEMKNTFEQTITKSLTEFGEQFIKPELSSN